MFGARAKVIYCTKKTICVHVELNRPTFNRDDKRLQESLKL